MFIQNFSFLASTQINLNTFLTIFEENFRIFQENSWGQILTFFQEKFKTSLEKIKDFPNLKKVLDRDFYKASFTKF
jgi:hypothetical protein